MRGFDALIPYRGLPIENPDIDLVSCSTAHTLHTERDYPQPRTHLTRSDRDLFDRALNSVCSTETLLNCANLARVSQSGLGQHADHEHLIDIARLHRSQAAAACRLSGQTREGGQQLCQGAALKRSRWPCTLKCLQLRISPTTVPVMQSHRPLGLCLLPGTSIAVSDAHWHQLLQQVQHPEQAACGEAQS